MRTLLLAAMIAMSACSGAPVVPVPIEPAYTSSCLGACNRMRELGCSESEPLPDGTSCEQFCRKTQGSGHALKPSCVEKIEICAEIDDCVQ